jgi:hypothetical protein
LTVVIVIIDRIFNRRTVSEKCVKDCFSGECAATEELLEPHENIVFHTRMKRRA